MFNGFYTGRSFRWWTNWWISLDQIIPSSTLRLRWRGGVVHLLQWNSPFLTPTMGPEMAKQKKSGERFQFFDFGSYCIWIVAPKTFLGNLLITSQRWHVPKEMKTRKITKGSYLALWIVVKSNPMQKSCNSSMWPTSFEEKCRCDFPTKSLQDSGRHPKADAETGSGARGCHFTGGKNADWLKTVKLVPEGFLNHQRYSCGRAAKKVTRHSQQNLDQTQKIKKLFQVCSKHFYADQKPHLADIAGEGSNERRRWCGMSFRTQNQKGR